MLNNIVDNIEQCGQHNIVQSCLQQPVTTHNFWPCVQPETPQTCVFDASWLSSCIKQVCHLASQGNFGVVLLVLAKTLGTRLACLLHQVGSNLLESDLMRYSVIFADLLQAVEIASIKFVEKKS